jgi:colanic acid/amylovoran biosynthesis glycosyltransferase
MPTRIAYLNTQYPSLSHTFIEREIRAVRAKGIEVHTFSINRPRRQDFLGDRHAAEIKNTYILKPSMLGLLMSQVGAVLRGPITYGRALIESQRLFPPGILSRLTSLGYLLEAGRLVTELDRLGVRHVHVHMANNGAAVAMLACVMDPRLTYSLTIHGSAEFFDVHRLNVREKTSRALFVRCISNFCKAQVMAWSRPEAWSQFHVVHCAVDPDELAPQSAAGASAESGPRPLRLVTVGRLEPIKGYPVLLDALATVVKSNPDVHLTMVGQGPMEGFLRSQIETLGLSRHVSMIGSVAAEGLSAVLDANDVLVVSSFMEGVPVVLMEAMAKGLVVISSAVGGVPELVTHDVSGFLVTPGSADSLAGAILDVSRRRESLGPVRTAARDVICREFNLHHLGRQMEALFEKYVRE